MQEFILVRFGNGPDKRVTQVIQEVSNGRAAATVLPQTIISYFQSEENEAIIRSKFDALNIMYELVNKSQIAANLPAPTGNAGQQRPTAQRRPAPTQTSTPPTRTVADVKAELRAAIDAENYEKASELRDELDRLEGRTRPTSERIGTNLITSVNEYKKSLKNKKKINEGSENDLWTVIKGLNNMSKEEYLEHCKTWQERIGVDFVIDERFYKEFLEDVRTVSGSFDEFYSQLDYSVYDFNKDMPALVTAIHSYASNGDAMDYLTGGN
jgi:hypothetical protein